MTPLPDSPSNLPSGWQDWPTERLARLLRPADGSTVAAAVAEVLARRLVAAEASLQAAATADQPEAVTWRPKPWMSAADIADRLEPLVGHRVAVNTHAGNTYSGTVASVLSMDDDRAPVLVLDLDGDEYCAPQVGVSVLGVRAVRTFP